MSNFMNRLLTITDAGDGDTLYVQNGPVTTPVSMAQIDDFINQRTDPLIPLTYNIASFLNLSGYTTIKNADNTGANPDALALLATVSFKGYA